MVEAVKCGYECEQEMCENLKPYFFWDVSLESTTHNVHKQIQMRTNDRLEIHNIQGNTHTTQPPHKPVSVLLDESVDRVDDVAYF